MDTKVKFEIIEAAKKWMTDKHLLAADLILKSGVSKGYITSMLQGKLRHDSGKGVSGVISDKMFVKVAEAIGYNIKQIFWEHVDTIQYIEAMENIRQAKEERATRMLIGQTGCGKTYAINAYRKKDPKDTVVVTVMDDDRVDDILEIIAEQLNIPLPKSGKGKIRRIGRAIQELSKGGRKIVIIIDEAENTKLPGIKAYKAIYDLTKEYCGFVLAGTEELPQKLDYLNDHKKGGIPQFLSRIDAGRRLLGRIDKSFSEFLDGKIEDMGLRNVISNQCRDYRMLKDYLEPALREAHCKGVELTEDFFRNKYNILKK